jgi:hypothetical protein
VQIAPGTVIGGQGLRRFTFRLGSGEARMTLSTFNGNITINNREQQ